MLRYAYEEKVHALLETMWKVMVDAAENPGTYLGGAAESRKSPEPVDLGFVREVTTQGMAIRERVFFDKDDCIIRYRILEHPLVSEGEIMLRAAPTSVQSPVAPVVLGLHLHFTPKVANDKALADADLPARIRREVQALKVKAEELERSA